MKSKNKTKEKKVSLVLQLLCIYVKSSNVSVCKGLFMLFTTWVVCMCVGDLSLAVNFSGSVQNHDLNRRSGLWLAIRTISRAESAFKKPICTKQCSHIKHL